MKTKTLLVLLPLLTIGCDRSGHKKDAISTDAQTKGASRRSQEPVTDECSRSVEPSFDEPRFNNGDVVSFVKAYAKKHELNFNEAIEVQCNVSFILQSVMLSAPFGTDTLAYSEQQMNGKTYEELLELYFSLGPPNAFSSSEASPPPGPIYPIDHDIHGRFGQTTQWPK